MTIIRILLIISISFLSCSREYIKPLNVKRNFSGSLWVVRHEISSREKIDLLLSTVKKTGIKNLFVQVRGRGDAYYKSAHEPAAFDVTPDFDPLEYIINRTTGTDIKIHAWINISFVFNHSDSAPPPDHILARHPEWITYDYRGRSLAEYSAKELKENLIEGYFLDPAIPGVKKHMVNIVEDILSKYNVAGIHLDYIRYPYSGYNRHYKKYLSDFGYNPISRKIFRNRYGVDPLKINRFGNSNIKKKFDQFRRDQITDIVCRINKTVKRKNRSIIFSTASMPRYDLGRDVYFQDWPLWVKKGYIDLACIMSYTNKNSIYKDYLDFSLRTETPEKIYMGVQVTPKTAIRQTHEQIQMSYNEGFRGYIIFSFKHDKKYIEKLNNHIIYDDMIFTY